MSPISLIFYQTTRHYMQQIIRIFTLHTYFSRRLKKSSLEATRFIQLMKCKGKAKLPLCSLWRCVGSGGRAPLIPNIGIRSE